MCNWAVFYQRIVAFNLIYCRFYASHKIDQQHQHRQSLVNKTHTRTHSEWISAKTELFRLPKTSSEWRKNQRKKRYLMQNNTKLTKLQIDLMRWRINVRMNKRNEADWLATYTHLHPQKVNCFSSLILHILKIWHTHTIFSFGRFSLCLSHSLSLFHFCRFFVLFFTRFRLPSHYLSLCFDSNTNVYANLFLLRSICSAMHDILIMHSTLIDK